MEVLRASKRTQRLPLFLFLGLCTIQFGYQQDLSYLNLVEDATKISPKDNYYDYIVVGGGTAGCPLAATLSENYTVLLVERGSDGHANPNLMLEQNMMKNVMQTEEVADSPVQPFTSEDGITYIRGRVLGGSSMVNFGFYSRGDAVFFNSSGINWDMDLVERSYEWVEETVAFRKNQLNPAQSSVKEALIQSGITPDNGFSLDHVEGTKITPTIFDRTGRRHGAVEFLKKAKPGNLDVIVNAMVERVLFSSPNSTDISAVGIIYKDSNDKSYEVHVHEKGEVILSAGALGSPQLLLVSGVGPSSYLSSLNIPIVHHQPLVGQFMIDPPLNNVTFLSSFSFVSLGDRAIAIQEDNVSYIIETVTGINPSLSSSNHPMITIATKTARPLSSGSLKLASKQNISISPIVRFNQFANPIDLSHCVNGLQTIGKLLRNPIMDQFKFEDKNGKKYYKIMGLLLPENLLDRGQMEEFCRKTLFTIYHYHGGCTMQKVTNSEFKVNGIKALRVVDGSTFAVSPGTNPQATLMMLGRYVGLKIRENSIL